MASLPGPEENTDAVDDTYLQTVLINNRLYQQYAITNQTYLVPMDEDELERLEIENGVLSRVFNNRLIFPDMGRPRRVLECGYGTANWAIQLAEKYERCEVIGIDINPAMQTDATPENLYLQVDDLNQRFNFQAQSFDLVHSQMMATGIHENRWTQYLRDIFHVTRRGGWCQMVELYYNFQSDIGSLTEAHALRQWSNNYLESMQGLKNLRIGLHLKELMTSIGFEEVIDRMIPLHTCGWSTDEMKHEIGVANRENVQRMLSSLAIYPFTERLQMSVQDVHLLIAQARREADDPALRTYLPLYVCIGRRPRNRR